MALHPPSSRLLPIRLSKRSILRCQCNSTLRPASTYSGTTELNEDVSPSSSFAHPPASQEQIKTFDPIARARSRKTPLPSSRYQYRSPRYYRGPLHPHQPPPPSDPASRAFIPGPFSLPRLEQTYHSTLAPDLLTLLYTHHPPGTLPAPVDQRLRSWDDSSPYHKNRPLRGPRGRSALPLLDRNITFRNIPRLDKIVVHSFLPDAGTDQNYIAAARMAVQAITNVRATVYVAKKSVQQFRLIKGKPCAVKVELRGEDMWEFLGKCVEVIMPRVKEWDGVGARSGDGSGDFTWKFGPETVGTFPEIEVNYDAYPAKMIPSIDVTVCTTATTDRDARLLLASLGVPFVGDHNI